MVVLIPTVVSYAGMPSARPAVAIGVMGIERLGVAKVSVITG